MTDQIKTATFIKDMASRTATQKLYRMDPPHEGHEYVAASGVQSAFDTMMPETYLFGADADGKITSYSELDGSFRGSVDHEEAIREAGYKVSNA